MKANELRIGNYVNDSIGLITIGLNGNIKFADAYHPIRLTVEWLLKLGFDKLDKAHFKIIQKDIFNSPFTITLDENEIFKFDFQGFWYQLEFLHQLQNLYYCLCGEELKIIEDEN
jgi:hypothetical protein